MTAGTNFLGLDDLRRGSDRVLAFTLGVAATYGLAALGMAVPFPGLPLVRGTVGGFVALFIWRVIWE